MRRSRHAYGKMEDRGGWESRITPDLEGVSNLLLFGDDRIAHRQNAEGPARKRDLHQIEDDKAWDAAPFEASPKRSLI